MKPGLKQPADRNQPDLARLQLIALTLTANGLGVAEIAARLGTSTDDIVATLGDAERKLGAHNRLHAVAIAVRKRLIGIEVKG